MLLRYLWYALRFPLLRISFVPQRRLSLPPRLVVTVFYPIRSPQLMISLIIILNLKAQRLIFMLICWQKTEENIYMYVFSYI